jgi:hypothetical protein
MRLPAEARDGFVKLPFSPTQSFPIEAFTEGKKGRLYFRFPHLRPGAVDATVQQIDRQRAPSRPGRRVGVDLGRVECQAIASGFDLTRPHFRYSASRSRSFRGVTCA